MHRRTGMFVVLAAFAALVALPIAAGAAELPDEMVDPPAAMAPELDAAADVEAEAAGEETVEVAALPDPTIAQSTAPAATPAVASYSAPASTGTLPFTGLGTDAVVLASILGTLFLLAGVTALLGARAAVPAQN